MPSAEKLSSEALKLESAPTNEPKSSENAQKDLEQNNGEKSIPPIQQVLQIINNKIRNLEKRKVSISYKKPINISIKLSFDEKLRKSFSIVSIWSLISRFSFLFVQYSVYAKKITCIN